MTPDREPVVTAAAVDRERLVWAAFVAGAVLAGGNGIAIRFSNRELAPLWGAGLRFALAAIVIVGVMATLHVRWPHGRALGGALLWGLLQFAGAFGLYSYALVSLHAGLGQTILALVPLATLLLAVAQRQERLRAAAVGGTLVALLGVGLISGQALQRSASAAAVLAVIGSVVCFAEAAVLVRRLPTMHPVALNAVAMVASAAVLMLASTVAGEPHLVPQRAETWIALGYVAAVGSVIVFLLYVFVLREWSASRAAYVLVVVPFVTVVLSAWLDNEPLTLGLVLGGLLIIGGVYVGALRRGRAAPRDAPGAMSR